MTPLRRADVDPHPLRQLARWLDEARAAGMGQPAAMALATSGPDGDASVRMVLVRDVGEHGVAFVTDAGSRKARELAARPRAALAAWWEPLGRQVRLEGPVAPLSHQEAEALFMARHPDNRVAAWAVRQGEPVAGREHLERALAAARARHPGDEVPMPGWFGGYRLVPDEVELWQEAADRMHDRLRYRRAGGGWRLDRLAP